jgi:hypothetical protein
MDTKVANTDSRVNPDELSKNAMIFSAVGILDSQINFCNLLIRLEYQTILNEGGNYAKAL